MKALFRVSDGWIFNVIESVDELKPYEQDLIKVFGVWGVMDIPVGLEETARAYQIVDGQFELIPVPEVIE